MKTLVEHINEHHNGNKAAFARAQGVTRQQVNQWINSDYRVYEYKLVSVKREILL